MVALVFAELVFLESPVVSVHKTAGEMGVCLSFAIAVLVGYIDMISNTLSLSRTFVFFPVFLAAIIAKRPF